MNKVLENTQKMLDRLKWLESEKCGCDKSGDMEYCKHCFRHLVNNTCVAIQEEREKYYHCAKAYKRMCAKKKEKQWLTK